MELWSMDYMILFHTYNKEIDVNYVKKIKK